MQEAILRLTSFWLGQGCHLSQPFNTEVGAGTLNPATFLRVLGPEPWHTVYVEPSVRPDDSRYGDNPHRLQTHTQLQVILKPDPGDPQERYLESLAAIGIDTRVHDVRFVEDNWESPALGAWGLGWEVWLDGMEITQFTYFQQAGGLALDPVSVEITYGLERILMAVQGVSDFKDIAYSADLSYGELVGQAELEMSTYYLDAADVDATRALFDAHEASAQRLIAERLPIAAHYDVLKCSHLFNVLDARGAVGTTERARAFRRMRTMAHAIAELWVDRREELGHPLGVVLPQAAPPLPASVARLPAEAATLALELGYEELPPDQVDAYAAQFATLVTDALDEHRIEHGPVTTAASPRRVIVLVTDVTPRQPDRVVRARGPKLEAAFDPDGNPTKAGQGFSRKHGVDPSALERETDGDVTYVVVHRDEPGRPTGDVLAESLAKAIEAITPRRAMRWSAGPAHSASRALRWVVALLGDAVVAFSVADVTSGRRTRVLRNAEEPEVDVSSADVLIATLRANDIEPEGAVRRQGILDRTDDLVREVSGTIDLDADGTVLDEVTNLVENPQPLLGAFEEQFLRLPPEVLTTVMKKHQRYFPVRSADGALLPRFVTVANGPVDVDASRIGNEAVLRARYADAAFFFDRDREQPLEAYRPGLAQLTFEEKAGTMLDRSDRIEALAVHLGTELGLDHDEAATLARAAHLAKADLATTLVVELSSLAGQMGRIYARTSGEPEAVAEAIFEGALPRYAGDALPTSRPGAVLAIADRADALVALFAAGAKPTGSNDPYALRRAATGLVLVIAHHHLPLSLDDVFAAAATGLAGTAIEAGPEVVADLREFVDTRFEVRLVDEGHPVDLVRSVAPSFATPTRAQVTLAELEARIANPTFLALTQAYRRTARISAGVAAGEVDRALLTDDAEVT
ncbi:MAG: glycine--tRNA ligase subunit beta, partial [Acidimicrobiales bacterium]